MHSIICSIVCYISIDFHSNNLMNPVLSNPTSNTNYVAAY
jgi:hypothetical protein